MRLLQCSVQHLVVVPGLRGAEGLAAEEGKIRLGEAGHGQLIGAQGLILELQLPVGAVVAILAVAQDGAADAGHVGADLVGAAGDEPDLEQGQTAETAMVSYCVSTSLAPGCLSSTILTMPRSAP